MASPYLVSLPYSLPLTPLLPYKPCCVPIKPRSAPDAPLSSLPHFHYLLKWYLIREIPRRSSNAMSLSSLLPFYYLLQNIHYHLAHPISTGFVVNWLSPTPVPIPEWQPRAVTCVVHCGTPVQYCLAHRRHSIKLD